MKSYKTVDQYITNAKQWQPELVKLREILLSAKLNEEVKWGAPTYTHEGKNIAAIAAFKSYVGLWFYQGALLKDTRKKLINAQEGVTKALRQWRFTSMKEIDEKLIKAYVKEAVQNQKEGKEIKPATNKPVIIPKELKASFKSNGSLHQSFLALSKGKQRDFAEYIHDAAKPETKAKRLEKIIPMISKGIGLNDKYK